MEKFVNYVEFHSVQPCDISEGRHLIPVMLFADTFEKKMGYKFTMQELSCLRSMTGKDSGLKR